MMEEAGRIPAGSNGVMVQPSFLPGSGISRRYNTAGTILGCTLGTTPAEIYRAFLEGLSFELREAMENLRKHAHFRADKLTVVGGGSRNGLWNRIRADVLNVPVRLTRQAENTVVGAAIFGFIGAGAYGNYDEAAAAMVFEKGFVEPSTRRDVYDGLYAKYRNLGPSLALLYRQGGLGPG
jgi:L-fuculokinase